MKARSLLLKKITGAMSWLIVLLFTTNLANAQNRYSFTEASTAFTDYSANAARPAQTCTSMVALTRSDFSVVSAELVAGTSEVPEHCRIAGVIPAEIRFEVNLPSNWNGRFYMHGNGGFAGTPPDAPSRRAIAAQAITMGFATAYTDTGHDQRSEPGGTFGHNNLAKVIDYGFRAVHLTALTAKTLINSYYQRGPSYSYFDGCSTGGRQAMISAQRFPDDFNGIVAGAPILNYTGAKLAQQHKAQAMKDRPVSPAEVLLLGEAVYAKCDAIDGLSDGLIDDPRKCDFKPAEDLPLCLNEDTDSCFTEVEIAAIETIYSPVISQGTEIFKGHTFSGEAVVQGPDGEPRSGWVPWIVNEAGASLNELLGGDFWRYLAFIEDDPDYDWLNHDLDELPDNLASLSAIMDATDPDLSAFRDGGGKVISYFGWAEPALNPLMMIDYRLEVVAEMGNDVDDFFRLFMVPGMSHCRGGVGPDQFDAMTALIDWVEGNIEPDSIIASQVIDGEVTRTRPLCPYPRVAMHQGFGSIDEAANFVCER